MRSTFAKLLAAALLVLIAGCARGSSAQDLLLVRAQDRLAVIDPAARRTLFSASQAVPSSDWSRVFAVSHHGSRTRLTAIDPATGTTTWSRSIEGNYEVTAVSHDGKLAALLPPHATEGGYPGGRSSTSIVLDGPGLASARHLDLRGNFAAEAFSLDKSALFVLEYTPADAPTRYRVRRLDLASGLLGGVFSVDGHLQQSMGGTARTQVMSADGTRLYTLYWLDGRAGEGRAFVHVLSLEAQWAHCIDLPRSVGSGAERANALALSPDGTTLYVGDAERGGLAEIDTKALRVARTASFGRRGAASLRAVVGPDRSLYIASGSQLMRVDPGSLIPNGMWSLHGDVSGIQTGSDGRRMYLAFADRIDVLDTGTGRRIDSLALPGRVGVEQLGLTSGTLSGARTTTLKCAC